MKIVLCSSCALGAGGFAPVLEAALRAAGIGTEVATVECMSGCARDSTLAFRAPGKTAYLFGGVVPDDLPLIVDFARAYADSADGSFADARRFGALRFKVLARIPA